jgi:hypothetical protein
VVVAEPSFLELLAAKVASVVESDDLVAKEEDVFGSVMAWVKEDEVARKVELDRLLPLVRFPLMAAASLPAIMAKPLVAQHVLFLQLLYQETHPAFAASAEAVTCPRLLPRTCHVLPALAFTRASAEHYDNLPHPNI